MLCFLYLHRGGREGGMEEREREKNYGHENTFKNTPHDDWFRS